MSKAKHTLAEAVLARMSLGAVPMDGIYWFDAKGMRHQAGGSHSSRAECANDSGITAANADVPKSTAKSPGWLGMKWWPLRRTGELP